MPIGKRNSSKISTDHLPGPIATAYRRIFTHHERDVDRLIHVLDTAETTARFLSAVVLGTLRELAQAGSLQPPIIDLGDPSMRLKKPSFGLWLEILREGARRLCSDDLHITDEGARILAGHLRDYVFNEQQKTKDRPYANLEQLVVIRNQVHHPSEELDIPTLCESAEDLVNESLRGLSFFEDFPLYVVKTINMRNRRLSEPQYEHRCFVLQGEIDFPTAETDDRNWHTETNEVLIYRDETSYLNLDPLLLYVHPDDIDKSKVRSGTEDEELYPGMYGFAGFAKKSSGIVVEYLPLASSTKSFRTSNDAFRDKATKNCLEMGVEELLQLLGKPVPETADA